jgi:hypothetical protein
MFLADASKYLEPGWSGFEKFITESCKNSMEVTPFEKSPVTQLLKIFPTFYGTQSFITLFPRALHWSLS